MNERLRNILKNTIKNMRNKSFLEEMLPDTSEVDEDLSYEKDSFLKVAERIFHYEDEVNSKIYGLMLDYLSKCNSDKTFSNNEHIDFISSYFNSSYTDNIYNQLGQYSITVFLTNENSFLKNEYIYITFNSYRDNREIVRTIVTVSSRDKLKVSGREIIKYFTNKALYHSGIRGKVNDIYGHREMFGVEIQTIPYDKIDKSKIHLSLENQAAVNHYIEATKIGKVLRYLFIGSPGTGKTETSRYIISTLIENGVTVFVVRDTNRGLINIFKIAELFTPSIVVFEDFDNIFGSRSNQSANTQELQTLLDILDGSVKLPKNLGLLATTNDIQNIDEALKRPPRFNKTLIFSALSSEAIVKLIEKSFNKQISQLSSHSEVILEKHKEVLNVILDEKVVKCFYDNSLTGAYIENKLVNEFLDVALIKLIEYSNNNEDLSGFSFEENGITVEKLIESISLDIQENESLKKKGTYLDSSIKTTESKKSMGFGLR
jgi:hypothetical protein